MPEEKDTPTPPVNTIQETLPPVTPIADPPVTDTNGTVQRNETPVPPIPPRVPTPTNVPKAPEVPMATQYKELLRRSALLMETRVTDDAEGLQVRYDCLKGLKGELLNFGLRALFIDQEVYTKIQNLLG